jgi:transcriptional regulator NrdR family protein
MKCPHCNASHIRVVTTRHEDETAILRHRTCHQCKESWITREQQIPGRLSFSAWPPSFETEAG